MSKFLKGTYKVKNNQKVKSTSKKSNKTEDFEEKAVMKLGGSIAFVAKSKLIWDGEDEKNS